MNDQQQEVVVNIMAKLKGLGVGMIHPLGVIEGPVVSGFRFTIPDHVSINKITRLENDLKLAIGEQSIELKQLGQELIIYVPNKERKTVDFKDMLFWFLKDPEVREMNLPIMLGIDPTGKKTAIDLTTLPHLLIAGATGSGKSVFESSVLASLAMGKSPVDLEIRIVDTKRVDLTLFEDLPHVTYVVKDIKEWYPMINDTKEEIDNRMKKLARAGVRNVQEYNKSGLGHMSYMVVIIDEMADLFLRDEEYRNDKKREYKQAKEADMDVEKFSEPEPLDAMRSCVAIARAAGVHFISCTQRTSVDVISGVVKNNFPARIALRVPASQDSRTILGCGGAENLLGRGDMLVKRPELDYLERFHGPFVKLEDIEQILKDRENIRQMLGVA